MEYNREQKKAIEFDGNNLLVLAGAGSGKTRTIIARVDHLIKQGVDPSAILVLSFTRKAASEIKERIFSQSNQRANGIFVSTFHHFCLFMIRKYDALFELSQYAIIDSDDQKSLMKAARKQLIEEYQENLVPKAPKLVELFSYSRNTARSVTQYLKQYTIYQEESIEKIIEILKLYQMKKKVNRYIDFDDILHTFAEKIEESSEIRALIKSKLMHILVDEMQDTNPLQWKILFQLQNPAKLFCVGDDAQSIYAFRGADFKNVRDFSERLQDAQTYKLIKNYRSAQEILDLSNHILKASPFDYDKELESVKGKNNKIPLYYHFETARDEAEWVVDSIKQDKKQHENWSNIMVLVRASWQAKSLEAVLIEEKIPYQFIGGVNIMQSAHVKDVLMLCRASLSLNDELAWERVLQNWPRIGKKTAEKIIHNLNQIESAEDAYRDLARYLPKAEQLAAIIQSVRRSQDEPSRALQKAVEGLEDHLKQKYDFWENRKKDLLLLQQLALNHDSLFNFLEIYTLEPVTSTSQNQLNQDKLTLITVHSAKGTEAECCYLLQAQKGSYPYVRSYGDLDQEEEERRILYVAMTRAKEQLIITGSYGSAPSWHMQELAYPSRPENDHFLRYVDDTLYDKQFIM